MMPEDKECIVRGCTKPAVHVVPRIGTGLMMMVCEEHYDEYMEEARSTFAKNVRAATRIKKKEKKLMGEGLEECIRRLRASG